MNLGIYRLNIRDAEKSTSKTRIYVSPENETIYENLLARHGRPFKVYKDQIIPELISRGIIPETSKVKWSQKAGCSCGCSPGFIVEGDLGRDIFVDVSE